MRVGNYKSGERVKDMKFPFVDQKNHANELFHPYIYEGHAIVLLYSH